MRKIAISLFALSLLGAGSALAQDGGTDAGPADAGTDAGTADAGTDDAGTPADGGVVEGCGDLTLQGECVGTMVRYCGQDANGAESVVEYDCATFLPDNPATCGEISAEWGFDCIIASGNECRYTNQNGDAVPTFCASNGACILDVDTQTSACTDGAGVDCTPDPNTGAATNATCLGNAALFSCSAAGRFVGLECTSGSTCTGGICTGTEAGGACAEGIATCAAGLTCNANGECVEAGTEPAPSPGAEPTPEGRTDPEPAPEEEPATCAASHSTKTNVPAGLAVVALLGLVAVRRRRR